jgi:hypothetical protein
LLASETHDTSTKEVEGQVIYHSWVGTVFGCYHWSHSFLWRLPWISLLHPWDSQSEIVGFTEFYSTSSNDKSKRRPGGGGDALVLLSLEWTTCTQNITHELNIFLMQHLSSQHRTQSWQGKICGYLVHLEILRLDWTPRHLFAGSGLCRNKFHMQRSLPVIL